MNTLAFETITYDKDIKENIYTIEQLEHYIDISPKEKKILKKIIERHPMNITPYYMSLIDKDDPNDPIRKMALPSKEEFNMIGFYDTSGEHENTKMPGLQHKYSQTALILSTSRCEMYCRHCFRKRLVGLPSEELIKRFDSAVEYIRDHKEIRNVLISGGDPLSLSTDMIAIFLEKVNTIEHIEFIRIGSRVPVTHPDRIIEDDNLLDLFNIYSHPNRRILLMTQFNHPREITSKSMEAVNRLIEANVILNNQAVLLKGVNDNSNVLSELLNKLVGIGVNPYYVFQCRPVKMVKTNFQVPIKRGYEIMEEAKKKCSGPSKRFKYIMAHRTGKIEILGIMDDYIFLKYLQAKNPNNLGKLFKRRLNDTAGWLDELE